MANIAIIDYGMGNLRSVQKAFEKLGENAFVATEPEKLEKADKLVLPGVGAIADAMRELKKNCLIEFISSFIHTGKPFLGICLGYQLLFDWSEENGGQNGLGIFPGKVLQFHLPHEFAVPHMGWNQLWFKKDLPIFKGLEDGTRVYFVHSYYVKPENSDIIATETDYGINFCSSVAKDNVFAVQFHPEKSQANG
ncbi:MAG: imidazole glycerol phosphate synthase subunit HisH, partial [Planctomycetia bacterium]|nr:imidazole glycerol phosphate synthase subunit HisH [Planctomycetia bacterium]